MDSEDEIEESAAYRGVPATIILINVFNSSTHKTPEIAHAATCRVIRQYLRQSSSQLVAVSLYGAEDDDDAPKLGAKSVVDVFPLTAPTLDNFKNLQKINIRNIKPAKELITSDVLAHCSKVFANCKKQLSTRNVIILSRLDAAPAPADQKPTLKRVEDIVEANVDLRIINIGQSEYEIDPFYENFIKEANSGRDTVLPKPVSDEKEIECLIYQQSHRHLAVSRLSFELGHGLNVGVGVYSLLKGQGQTRQKTSNLDRETNAVLTSVTKTMKVSMEKDTEMDVDGEEQASKQMPLLKSELIHYQEYGGERVEFTDSEMKKLKNPFGPPMLKLLGFKPASLMCKEKWFLKGGYFLFPNEGIIEGSTVAFKAMHQACVDTGMVAICILCTRVNSRPINVVLSPCTNPLGLDIDIGFDVICIPFVENVRDLPIQDDENTKISDAHKIVMKDAINCVKFDYRPDMFENPKLQAEYRAIEAIALEDLEVEPFVDTTKPPAEKFSEIQDNLFHELFGPFGIAPVKRMAIPKDDSVAKKVKYEEIDEVLLQNRIASNCVNKYTVPELRQILKSKEIPGISALTGMKKAELIDLVCTNFK